MNAIPRRLLKDVVTVQSYQGETAVGPDYADPVSAYGRVEMVRQLVRDSSGSEVLSEMTIYLHPDDAAPFVAESLVTFDGYVTTVLAASTHSRPGQAVLAKAVCR